VNGRTTITSSVLTGRSRVVHRGRRWLEKLAVTPFHDQMEANYNASAERIRHPDFRMDLKLAATNPRTGFF